MWNFSLAIQKINSIGYVYQWTNKITGTKYIGSHCGNNPRYLGSGKLFKLAVKKYGIKNFNCEFLYIGNNFRQVEQELLIILDVENNSNFYNLKNSVEGNRKGYKPTKESIQKSIITRKNYKHSQETKEKMRLAALGEKNHNFGKKLSAESIAKRSKSVSGENHYMYGKQVSDTRKLQISLANKGKIPANKGIPHSEETKKLSAIAGKKGSGIGNHNRWHKNRNIIEDWCEFCVIQ